MIRSAPTRPGRGAARPHSPAPAPRRPIARRPPLQRPALHRPALARLALLSLVVGLTGCSGSPSTPGSTTAAGPAAGSTPSTASSPAPLATTVASIPARTVSVIPPSAGGGPGVTAGDRTTEVVSRFYSAYLARPGRATAANFVDPPLLAVLFAPQAAFDRVVCGHTLPDSITVAPATPSGSSATVQVTPTHQGATRPPIEVTVRASDQRITRIDCAD
ncbi:MAG: hypothetical protein JNL54_20550 [Kineosporiaceae bacterium]|nr:hypothetical protein [Kineosporiaceae bacterium]